MRKPETPPNVQRLWKELAQKKGLQHLLELRADDQQYVHWDKLRHVRPPAGLSHEEWWFAIKMGRRGNCREIPLTDVSGQPFKFAMPDPVPERLHHIDQEAGGQIMTEGPPIATPEARERYIIHSLIEEAITSSQLEGAATTRVVAKEMIRTNRAPRDRNEQMILNNYAAMREIQRFKDRPLDRELILKLHRIVTHETLDDPSATGRLRRPDETIDVATPYNEVLHTPPPAEELPRRLELLCDFANGAETKPFIHPVLRAIILHFWLAYDHPFVDGNGRSARALFYWSMLRQGYWLFEFLSISQIIRKAPAKYGRAFLYCETDDNDLTYFILYHLEVIQRALGELQTYVARKTEQMRQTEKLLRASERFNHRQLALLTHALRHADAQYTINSHRTSHGVVYQTARTDLFDLVDKGLLVKGKAGRRMVFRPVEDLQEALKALR
jgi:Fic family protein